LVLILQGPLALQAFFIPKFWVIFGFMAVITLLVFFVSYVGINRGGEGQVFVVMGAIVIRLLISMVVVLFYLSKFKIDPILFVINFFSIYLSFTTFEIYCLLLNLRHQIKK
jgi:amino acid transporter